MPLKVMLDAHFYNVLCDILTLGVANCKVWSHVVKQLHLLIINNKVFEAM